MATGVIAVEGGWIRVRCQPHVAIKLQRVFAGSKRVAAGQFVVKATPAAAHELEWFRRRYPMDVDAASDVAFLNLVDREERRIAQIAEVERPGYEPREFRLALPPRDYQRAAADLALRTRGLLVADDLGLGKTITAICALVSGGALPAAVVTMTYLPRQWQRQIARFAPELRVHRIRTRKPYDLHRVQLEADAEGRRRRPTPGIPDVVILNYHKIDGWVESLAGTVRCVVFDEVQELRHDGTNKYEAAKALADACDLRIGLSATPIINYGDEVWPVLNVIAPDVLGAKDEFLREWCTTEGRKHRVAEPAALGTHLRAAGVMVRRTRREVGRELPELTVVRVPVEVDAKRIHEVVESVAELASRVLARSGSNFELMQWSNELDWRLRQATGIGKAPAVIDHVRLLVEAGERVILYGWHHEVYAIWRSALARHGVTFAMYTGEESERDKGESYRRFVAGEVSVLIMSLRAGQGLDGLQEGCHVVVIGELDWSPKIHDQDVGRVHRDGQTEPCFVYYMVAEEGSDPVIADVCGIKDAQSTGILDPESAGEPVLVGASADHIRRLATDVLRRSGRGEQLSAPAEPVRAQLQLEVA